MQPKPNDRATLEVGDRSYEYVALRTAESGPALPFTLRILLENLQRHLDGDTVTEDDITRLLAWDPRAQPCLEIAFRPSRVLLQDFTGVPALVDLAAMRDAMARLGADPARIDPLQPAELVIDHSVQVDQFASPDALATNSAREFERNGERYAFLRWGQKSFENFAVVPPSTGIVHQVNLEYLARVVFDTPANGEGHALAYPDTLVGTDSHTTMINGLGVLGWGVGGIEAEAAMLGQPVSMLVPQVVGVRLHGTLPGGATATDVVLTVTEVLRAKGVVGKFVEFFGSGLAALPLADRATIANMAPEYGATCGFFPVDGETLRYLRLSGRDDRRVALVEAYCRAQSMFYDAADPTPRYSDVVDLDLANIVPSIAGPRRPQDRVALSSAKAAFAAALPALKPPGADDVMAVTVDLDGDTFPLGDGSVVIAAITSCTNTSNPSVMLGAGLLARNAVRRGLNRKPWVKTSLAPGSKVVSGYLEHAGLDRDLEKLGFHTVGYGCTTCIGNSGPLPAPIEAALADGQHVVAAVLSGNRNFEGRIHARVRANYLMSPPLVVAYALAGRMDIDLTSEPLGQDKDGKPVFLHDIWPTPHDVARTVEESVRSEMYRSSYDAVFEGDETWRALPVPEGRTFAWDEASTYIRHPPYFDGFTREVPAVSDVRGARVLVLLGDSVTTDHISPAGAIAGDGPASAYLRERGVDRADFNSYGSRRGNHELMHRGTFANVRLRNRLVPGTEGGFTRHLPGSDVTSIFEASELYRAESVPLIVIAGKEYGTGSSRDWAAKGPALLGIRAVIARSYERIHRSNLIGMGIAPLEFTDGASAESLGLTGEETFDIVGLADQIAAAAGSARTVTVRAVAAAGAVTEFSARLRLDTPREADYFRHGGILPFVLRRMVDQG